MENKGDVESGYLVHIFTGSQSPCEVSVLRKICMKYGLTQWDLMQGYLPWRQRSALRATICRLIKKQAISEYDNIRADPFAIQKDNEELINNPEKLKESGYIFKGGLLVSTKWDRANSEWERARQENTQKYEISKEQAEKINIPSIISIDYMRQQCFKRRQSLLLYRAALLSEIARREGRDPGNLGVDEIQIRSGCDVVIPKASTKLETDTAVDDIFFYPGEESSYMGSSESRPTNPL